MVAAAAADDDDDVTKYTPLFIKDIVFKRFYNIAVNAL